MLHIQCTCVMYTEKGVLSGPTISQKVLCARIRSLSGTLMRHRAQAQALLTTLYGFPI